MTWINKYPQILDCIQSASEIVGLLRKNPEYELEARFGTLNQRFQPGITRKKMDDIIDMMQKSNYVIGDDEWKEELDCYFMHDNKYLRTRVKYDSNSMTVNPETTEKTLVKSVDYILKHEKKEEGSDIRISLKTENDVCNYPSSVNPILVRIKQHRRFVTANKIWAFDFSMTWSGKTRSEAEIKQMNSDPIFEFECELMNTDILLEKTNEYIACSLLLKMMDFLPENSQLILSE